MKEIENEKPGDYLLESSGRKFYGVCNHFSIDESGEVGSGFDETIDTNDWTAQERAELADEMIRRWTAFK